MFRRKKLFFSSWIPPSKFDIFDFVTQHKGRFHKKGCYHTCFIPIIYWKWRRGITVLRLLSKPFPTVLYQAIIPRRPENEALIETLRTLG